MNWGVIFPGEERQTADPMKSEKHTKQPNHTHTHTHIQHALLHIVYTILQ